MYHNQYRPRASVMTIASYSAFRWLECRGEVLFEKGYHRLQCYTLHVVELI